MRLPLSRRTWYGANVPGGKLDCLRSKAARAASALPPERCCGEGCGQRVGARLKKCLRKPVSQPPAQLHSTRVPTSNRSVVVATSVLMYMLIAVPVLSVLFETRGCYRRGRGEVC
eukprot:scaffold76841_cov69-Phaeocystis_antarctica.AAC.7